MNLGDLVWWWVAKNQPLFGHVHVLEDRPGVKVVGTEDVLYLDGDQIYTPQELPDGVYRGFPYHTNPARLSPNAAKKLLEPGGPAKYDYERKHGRKSKAAFDFGKLVHLFVLGEGDQVAPIHFPNYTTKAAKEQRDKAHEAGLIPALAHEIEAAAEMARVVHNHPLAGELFASGEAETWLYATLDGQGLRMRTDWMTQHDGRVTFVEYKTAADANPATFGKTAEKWGYHLAFAWAVTCSRLLELDDNPAYLYVVTEKDPPYLTSVCELDADAYRLGRDHIDRAIAIHQQCSETGEWPGYSDGINPISLPPWAFTSNQPKIGDLLDVCEP